MGCDIMDFDSIRLLLESLEEKLKTLKDAIKVDDKKKELINLEKESMGRNKTIFIY